jgi:hypothetical protein
MLKTKWHASNSTTDVLAQTYSGLRTCTAFFMNDTQCQKATEIYFFQNRS